MELDGILEECGITLLEDLQALAYDDLDALGITGRNLTRLWVALGNAPEPTASAPAPAATTSLEEALIARSQTLRKAPTPKEAALLSVIERLDPQTAARRMQSRLRMMQLRRKFECSLANTTVVAVSI